MPRDYFNDPRMFSQNRRRQAPQAQPLGGVTNQAPGMPPAMQQMYQQALQQGAGKPQGLPPQVQQMLGQPQRGFGPGVNNFAPQNTGQMGQIPQQEMPNVPMVQQRALGTMPYTPQNFAYQQLADGTPAYQQPLDTSEQAYRTYMAQVSFAPGAAIPSYDQWVQQRTQNFQKPLMSPEQMQAANNQKLQAFESLGQPAQNTATFDGKGGVTGSYTPQPQGIASMTPEQRMAFGLGSNPVQTLGQSPAMQSLGQVATGQQQVPEWVRLAQQSGNMQNPFAQQAQGMPQPAPSQPPQAVTGNYANMMQQAQGLQNMTNVKPMSAPVPQQQTAQQTQTQPAGISSLGNKPQGGGGLF